MFRSIINIFKAIDTFLTVCEEYTEQRVWNGKFLIDLKFLSHTTFVKSNEYISDNLTKIRSSHTYITIRNLFQKLVGFFMRFEFIADVVRIIAEGNQLYIKNFAHYLFVLILSLYSVYFLLITARNAPLRFVIALLPLLLANHIVFIVFLNLIERKITDSRSHFKETLLFLKQKISSIVFFFFIQASFIFITVVFHIGFAFFIKELFVSMNIPWSDSFFYWLPVIITGLILTIILTIFEILVSFAYAFLDTKKAFQALQQSAIALRHNARYSLFFYCLLLLCAGIGIFFLNNAAHEGGIVLGFLFASHAFLMFGFLLRKKYFKKDPEIQEIHFSIKLYLIIVLTLVIGFFSYIGFAALFLRIQPLLIQYIDETHQVMNTYTPYKDANGYTVEYPKSWSVYKLNDTATTFCTNDTGTNIGNIKVIVNVTTIDASNYLSLYDATSGRINDDTENIIIKIANVVVNDNEAVKYTNVKIDKEKSEFQTHYLVRNNNTVYDISLITYSQQREAEYLDTFESMVKSFTVLHKEQ